MNENENNPFEGYVGLGSNISPEINLPRALERLREAVKLSRVSSIWETPPVGSTGPDFLNAVALIQTGLSEEELSNQVLKEIEAQLGRIRTPDHNAPRTIDLDILIFNGKIRDDQIWEQAHLALPLSELIPGLIHPRSGESIEEVAARLSHANPIRKRALDIAT